MHPLPERRWLVAKITKSAIHHAQEANTQPNTTSTNISIKMMKKILPARAVSLQQLIETTEQNLSTN